MQSFQIRAKALIFIRFEHKIYAPKEKKKLTFRCYRTFFVMGTHFKSNWPFIFFLSLFFFLFGLILFCFEMRDAKQKEKFKYGSKKKTTTQGVTKSHDCHIITNRLEHISRLLFKDIFVYYYAHMFLAVRQILCHRMRWLNFIFINLNKIAWNYSCDLYMIYILVSEWKEIEAVHYYHLNFSI